MPVKPLPHALLYSLLLAGSTHTSMARAEDEPPSMAFLEYLGSEESQVDNEWTGPVDMDIEQYLVSSNPETGKQSSGKNLDNP